MLYIGGDDDSDVKKKKKYSKESEVEHCHPGFCSSVEWGLKSFAKKIHLDLIRLHPERLQTDPRSNYKDWNTYIEEL